MEHLRDLIKDQFERALTPVAGVLLRLDVTANQVSVTGALLNLVAAALILTDNLVLETLAIDPAQASRKLGEVLGINRPPRTIEGIDVANIAGRESVGSLVTFIDGKPFKRGYRRFKIKTVEGIDDYAMICEVVARRYTRLRETDAPVADVLLIDGGAGHLNAAVGALNGVGLLPGVVASLAKREEVLFVHGREEPLRLPRRSLALRLLQYVRDEAHRFAQHYHHILRSRTVKPPPKRKSKDTTAQ